MTVGSIGRYFENYSLFHYGKGQILISNGEAASYVYYLVRGRVKVYDVSYRGDEIVLRTFGPGDVFPISHMIRERPNHYIYAADTEIDIKRSPVEEVRELFDSNPAITLQILRKAYDYIESVLSKQVLLMAGSARSKLIYELLIYCREYGKKADDGTIILDISEKDLGSRVGLSRETVNREVKKLKAEQLIALKGRSISVLDLDALERKLGRAV